MGNPRASTELRDSHALLAGGRRTSPSAHALEAAAALAVLRAVALCRARGVPVLLDAPAYLEPGA